MRETQQDETSNELALLCRDPLTGTDLSVITLSLEPPSHRISQAGRSNLDRQDAVGLVRTHERQWLLVARASPLTQPF